MTYLVLVTPLPGVASRPLEVDSAGILIGRAGNCDLCLPDLHISNLHAELVWEDGQLVLRHHSRTNTTRVNGENVEGHRRVGPGDTIVLSETIELRLVERVAEVEVESRPVAHPEAEPRAALSKASLEAPRPGETRAASTSNSPRSNPSELFIAIVGSGPAGVAAAVQAAVRGVPHVLIERSSLANTIERYQKGKLVMAEPTRLDLQPDLNVDFQQATREEVLTEWISAVERAGVATRVGPEHELVGLRGEAGAFELSLKGGDVVRATHVVIAIGLQGNLRRFGVPGDDLPHVCYQLDDPADFEDQSIVVVGAGDAGIENALALAEFGNRVAIVNRREEFDRAKSANRSLLDSAVRSDKITLYKNTVVDHFEENCVFLKTPEGTERLDASMVIGRLGAIPPRAFLEGIGIEFPSAAREAVPVVSERYESNVAGVHLVGAVAGYPLIKNCLNQGFEAVEHILGEPVVAADEPVLAEVLEPLGMEVPEAIERIRSTLPLFSSLTPIQLREFLFDSKLRRVGSGEIVYERNDFDNTLLSIVEGEVRASVPKSPEKIKLELDEAGRTQLLSDRYEFRYAAGEFFGEIGLISGRRRSETVEAVSDCVLIESPRLAMSRLLNSSSAVRDAIDAAFAIRALERLIPGVSNEDRRALAASAKTRAYKPDEALFQQGDTADGLYLIRRGSVSLSQKRDGREVVIQYMQAGNLLGERGVLSQDGKRGASVRAKTLVEVLWMPIEAVRALLEQNPGLERDLRAQVEARVGDVASSSDAHRGTVMFLVDQTGAYEATDLLLIDESLCVRCNNCEKACAQTHGGVSRLDREAGPTYQSSNGAQLHLPTACQHCENPKCMDDCPPDALHRDRNGEVYVRDNCIGCGNCARNCPYGVIEMAAVEPYRPRGILWRLLFGDPAPDAAAEKKAVKCDLCMELPDPTGNRPKAACVASCPTGAIIRADPRKLVDQILQRS